MQHLIFDCDGVIVDSEIVATRVSLRMLKPFGYERDELHHATRYAGLLEHEILQRLREEEGLPLPLDFGPKLVQAVTQRMFDELEPVAGMPDLIRQLPSPLTVVSNSRLHHVERSLAVAGVRELVGDRMFSAEQVARPKPHPDVYLHAIQRMGYAPQDTLVVEDSEAGAKAALAAGLSVIGFLGASHIGPEHADRLRTVGVQQLAVDAQALAGFLGISR